MKKLQRLCIVGTVLFVAFAFAVNRASAGTTNVAPQGTASQSSIPDGYGDPEFALDGSLGTFSHTMSGEGLPATWTLELAETVDICSIVLHNRNHPAASARLRDITVSVLDEGMAEVFVSELLNPGNRNGPSPAFGAGQPCLRVDFGAAPVTGKFVRVVRTPDAGGSGDDADVLTLSEVEVNVGSPTLVNVAEEGTASQSSTPDGFGDAAFAIDGVLSPTNNFSHTASGENLPATWELELAAKVRIQQIVLYNRDHPAASARLRDITVSILDLSGTEVYMSELLNPANALGGPASLTVDLTGAPVAGSVVRVVRTPDGGSSGDDADVLTLAEVDVLVDERDLPVDIAQTGTTSQSSIPDGYGHPDMAIDGNLGTFSHTVAGENLPSTWELELPMSSEILSVVLHNRDHAAASARLRDVTVSIFDGGGTEVFTSALLNPDNVLGGVDFEPRSLTVCVDPPVHGKIVRVVRTPDAGGSGDDADVLTLSEVKVFVTSSSAMTLVDVAPDGTTSQSSIPDGYGDPDFAIDGNLGTFSHTAGGVNLPSTWELELGQSIPIRKIVLHNRNHGAASARLRDVLVSILDGDGTGCPVYTTPLLNPDDVLGTGDFEPRTLTVDLTRTPVSGNIVRVVRLPDPGSSGDDADVLSLAEVEVLAAESDIVPPLVDIAWQESSTSQSSIPDGYGDPDFAIDGNLGTFSHTAGGVNLPSTWELELSAVVPIRLIVLHNRMHAAASARLRDVTVSILDGDGAEVFTSDLLNPGNALGGTDFEPRSLTVDLLTTPVNGRTIRVVRTPDGGSSGDDADVLSLAEVEVFVFESDVPPLSPAIDVAPFGVATQSSDFFTGLHPAENAVDGDLDTISHTATEDETPSWELALGTPVAIRNIILHNRGGGQIGGSRFRDITVSILNENGGVEVVFESDLLNPENELGVGLTGPASLELDLTELTGGPVLGNIVHVARTVDPDLSGTGGQGNEDEARVLSLAEVEVLAVVSGPARIVSQPQGARVPIGESFAFSATALGAAPISYQWAKDGVDVDGATDPTLELADLDFDDSGTYSVTASNGEGMDTSEGTVLEVTPRNLALFGEPVQSSTVQAASRANDGDFGTASETENIPGSFWQVVLAGESTIDTVVLFGPQLSNIRLSVLDHNLAEVFGEDLVDGDGAQVDLPADTVGRVVRVRKMGGGAGVEDHTLSIEELEIFGDGPESVPPPPDPNLARRDGVMVSQSSAPDNFDGSPELAIDGNPNTFSHTGVGENLPSTWELELVETADIALIELHNRAHPGASARLRDITVLILDEGGTPQFATGVLNAGNALGGTNFEPRILTVDLVDLTGGTVAGKIIRVVREPDTGSSGDDADVLSLAEVVVLEPMVCPPEGDTHCTGLTVDGPIDESGVHVEGLYVLEASGFDEEAGQLLNFTFTADNGIDPPQVVGPQRANNVANLNITSAGLYTFSVSVDDDVGDAGACDDVADDATCSVDAIVTGLINVAGLGTPFQSSTGFGLGPELALDGNLATFTHTEAGVNVPSTWGLQLADRTEIDLVVIHNRGAGNVGGSRLRDITVSIRDGATETFRSELLNPANELGSGIPGNGPAELTLDLGALTGGPVRGTIIQIIREPDPNPEITGDEKDVLALAEVEVLIEFGLEPIPPDGLIEPGDSNTDGRVDMSDAIRTARVLFVDTNLPLPCSGSLELGEASFSVMDWNQDENLTTADVIAPLQWLFRDGFPHRLGRDCLVFTGCPDLCDE